MVWFGALVLWCFGALVLWCFGALVLWCFGALVLWWFGGLVVWDVGRLRHLASKGAGVPPIPSISGVGQSKPERNAKCVGRDKSEVSPSGRGREERGAQLRSALAVFWVLTKVDPLLDGLKLGKRNRNKPLKRRPKFSPNSRFRLVLGFLVVFLSLDSNGLPLAFSPLRPHSPNPLRRSADPPHRRPELAVALDPGGPLRPPRRDPGTQQNSNGVEACGVRKWGRGPLSYLLPTPTCPVLEEYDVKP